ncbi:MAG: AmmeMemoRadiSam system protein B [Acidimicrobiia bacterium]|nr:AmmeMemoRadiSam system protein B [Acidimicrobiia bacterium]
MSTEQAVRPPAVAGSFYPAEPAALRTLVDDQLAAADERAAARGPAWPEAVTTGDHLGAVIVPHAGLVYSGPVAAAAYALLRRQPRQPRTVVLIGPAHRERVRSMAVSGADRFRTPLGDVPAARALREMVAGDPDVAVDDGPHRHEHALEVQLPFLQRVLRDSSWQALALVVGGASPEATARVLRAVWDPPDTLVVVSTDLSHYLPRPEAVRRDRATLAAAVALESDDLTGADACGVRPLRATLELCRQRVLQPVLLEQATSADTGGPPDRVVGYASLAVTTAPPTPAPFDAAAAAAVLDAVAARLHRRLGVPYEHRHDTTAHPRLAQPAATFVTLRHADGSLAGCVGTIPPPDDAVGDTERRRRRGRRADPSPASLIDNALHNAEAAAFSDPRLPALTAGDLRGLRISVSVVGSLQPLRPVRSPEELAEQLVPPLDGVWLSSGRARGTFLPAVWDQFDRPITFCRALWDKAGLASTPDGFVDAWRYRTTSVEP